jgi:NAD+ diphosphatase
LMLGFTAIASAPELQVGPELEHAQWFSLGAFEHAITQGALKLPPPVSVSFRLIEHWYNTHPQKTHAHVLVDLLAATKR